MKVGILNKKMITPCIPTPQNLKNYNISLTDQLTPPMNVPIILFYSSSSRSNDFLTSINHLQKSLANILQRFYPWAGRYISKDRLVHCNDEGVEFVEARAFSDNFNNMSEYVTSGKHEQLNDLFLPRLSCEADEVTDPIVSIQVTGFACGGLAIGLSVSHRIVDADSISTFIRAWVEEANNHSVKEGESIPIIPSFDSPTLLPFKNLYSGSEDFQLPRTIDPNIISKRFLFNKDAIATLKSKITDGSRRVSKVNVVCALISKALIRVDRLKHGRSRNFLIAQAVNIRDRTIPPFPKNSCGNLAAQATLKLCPSNSSDDDDDRKLNVDFEELVFLLRGAIDETIADCAGVFKGAGDEGHSVLYDSVMDLIETITSNSEETNVFFFSDWSKCEFYEADFGWGKPIWTSIATMRGDNLAVLMDDKEGEGIEAWVHLFKEDMVLFEKDEDIVRFDTIKI